MTEGQARQDEAQSKQRRGLCEYIRNTAQVPLAVHDFDDDWTPAGRLYRDDLVAAELIEIRTEGEGEPGGIYLTAAGEEVANGAQP